MEKITEKSYLEALGQNEISNIHFYGIDFSEFNFSSKNFTDCKFENCNLSNSSIVATVFNNVDFIKTKIMGMNFWDLNHFLSNFNFLACNITLSSFFWVNLKGISFKESEVKETDFTNAILENSNFSFCDLEESIFSNSNLKNSIFLWAYNFSINPTINNLEKTKFSKDNLIWLLDYLDIIID